MRSKLTWFASAAALWFAFCFIGYVGMVARTLEGIFDRVSAAEVMTQGAEWMMFASLGLALIFLAPVFVVTRLQVRRTLADLGLMSVAAMFGSLFIWTLVQDAKFLLLWALMYAGLFLKPFVIDCRSEDPAWRRWALIGLTALTAAFILAYGSL